MSLRKSLLPVLALCGLAAAHEIGSTRVSARFPGDGTYAIEIVTDGTALTEKLQGASIDSPKFRQRVKIAFDDTPVDPSISYSVTPAPDATSAPAATIRLTGQIPANARQLTWTFGWTFATYAFQAGNATEWLEGSQPSKPISLAAQTPPPGRLDIIGRYLTLGFTHIVPHGLDHMLFVLGIYLLSRRARSVLLQVSAFTIAHSITLGLSIYGVVSVSPRIVEPMIALSIAYVAIENLFLSELRSWRLALVFGFGLLHGLGFAGVLQELGLPRAEFLTALISFNVGVEAGQLAVIAAAFLLVGWHYSNRSWYRSRIVIPASLMIACTAIYWTVERLIA